MRVQDLHVLVADDVNAMRVQIRDLLKGVGFEKVHLVSSGQEALDTLSRHNMHLILSDWRMEPMGGVDLLKAVRNHPQYHNLAFVLVTAESAKDHVVQAIQAGVDDYLVKPLTVEAIQSKVFKTLIKRGFL